MDLITAKKIDIETFLAQEGYQPISRKAGQSWYLSPFGKSRESKATFEVNSKRNEWFDFACFEGGDILDLVMLMKQSQNKKEAIHYLQEKTARRRPEDKYCLRHRQDADEMTQIQYAVLRHNALLSYLLRKKIDFAIARRYCCEVHYVINRTFFFALAFKNRSLGYEIRNQYYQGCLGTNDITEIRQNDLIRKSHICVFLNFMDFLSYMTLKKNNDKTICIEEESDYVILNSLKNAEKAKEVIKEYDYIHSYLDNQEVGQHMMSYFKRQVSDSLINESKRYNLSVDLNSHLVHSHNIQLYL